MADSVVHSVSPKARLFLAGLPFSWRGASTRSALLSLAFAVAVAGVLRFTALGKQSLWYDEIFSAHMVTTPLGNMWRETHKEPHPPLYYLLLRLWMAGFRFDDFASRDFALRAFSAFWGTVAVAAIGWTAWRVNSPAAGALAASFASVLPPLVHYGQEARMYSLLVVLLTLALAGALFWHRDRSRRSGWLYALALAAALYTHYHSVFVWMGIALSYGAYLVWQCQWATLRKWLTWNLAPAVIGLPWLPMLLTQWNALKNNHWLLRYPAPDAPAALNYPLYCFGITVESGRLGPAWNTLPDGRALTYLALGCAWAWLALRQRSERPAQDAPGQGVDAGRMVLLLGASVVPIALLWGVSQYHTLWTTRFLQISVPALICLTATALARLRSSGVALLVGGFLLASSALASVQSLGNYERDQWREAAQLIRAQWRPGDTVVLTPAWSKICLTQYGIASTRFRAVPDDLPDSQVAQTLRPVEEQSRRIWLVTRLDPTMHVGRIGRYIETTGRYKLQGTAPLTNITVDLYEDTAHQ